MNIFTIHIFVLIYIFSYICKFSTFSTFPQRYRYSRVQKLHSMDERNKHFYSLLCLGLSKYVFVFSKVLWTRLHISKYIISFSIWHSISLSYTKSPTDLSHVQTLFHILSIYSLSIDPNLIAMVGVYGQWWMVGHMCTKRSYGFFQRLGNEKWD